MSCVLVCGKNLFTISIGRRRVLTSLTSASASARDPRAAESAMVAFSFVSSDSTPESARSFAPGPELSQPASKVAIEHKEGCFEG